MSAIKELLQRKALHSDDAVEVIQFFGHSPSTNGASIVNAAPPKTPQEMIREVIQGYLREQFGISPEIDVLLNIIHQLQSLPSLELGKETNKNAATLLRNSKVVNLEDAAAVKKELLSNHSQESTKELELTIKRITELVTKAYLQKISETVKALDSLTSKEAIVPTTSSTSFPTRDLADALRLVSKTPALVNHDAVATLLVDALQMPSETVSAGWISLLNTSTHPLFPLKVVLESAIKVLQQDPQEPHTEEITKILKELLKDVSSFISNGQPLETIQQRLLDAVSDIRRYEITYSPEGKILRSIQIVEQQIDILTSSDELWSFASTDGHPIPREQLISAIQEALTILEKEAPTDAGALLVKKLSTILSSKEPLGYDEKESLKVLARSLRPVFLKDNFLEVQKEAALLEMKIMRSLPESAILPSLTRNTTALFPEFIGKITTGPEGPVALIESYEKLLRSEIGSTPVGKELPFARVVSSLLEELYTLKTKLGDITTPEHLMKELLHSIDLTKDAATQILKLSSDPALKELLADLTGGKDGAPSISQLRKVLSQTHEARTQGSEIAKTYEGSLTKAELMTIRTAQQMIQVEQTLRQIRPVVESLGQPAFILFPALFRGFLTPIQFSSFTLEPDSETESRETSPDKSFQCLALKLTLPKLGPLTVYIALRKEECHLAISADCDETKVMVDQLFSKTFKPWLMNRGYTKINLEYVVSVEATASPTWMSNGSHTVS